MLGAHDFLRPEGIPEPDGKACAEGRRWCHAALGGAVGARPSSRPIGGARSVELDRWSPAEGARLRGPDRGGPIEGARSREIETAREDALMCDVQASCGLGCAECLAPWHR